MKKQAKGAMAFLFLGGIMATSGVVIGVPGIQPHIPPEDIDAVNPADSYPLEERARYCGTGSASSTPYVKEFAIPTPCTQPLGIVADGQGNIWFAETNTGNLAKFITTNGTFKEYVNPSWPGGARSMMWGMEYAPDGSVWYTDDRFNSVWKFSTLDERYTRFNLAESGEDLLPQRIELVGSQLIVNDFIGNNLVLFDPTQGSSSVTYVAVPPPISPAVTAEFAVDDDNNVWYTNWQGTQPGLLVRFDQDEYYAVIGSTGADSVEIGQFVTTFSLPPDLFTPNGIAITGGLIWMADTSSSLFFSFDPITEQFTRYITAPPQQSTYGNHTGLTFEPISRPYWMEADNLNRIVFNEHNANNIAVFDPQKQSLTEYHIPSKNPFWADCDPGTGLSIDDCGLAQIFDIALDGSNIWFTEWVENNIGVVDTTVALPFEILLDSAEVTIPQEESLVVTYTVIPASEGVVTPILAPADPRMTAFLAGPDTITLGSEPVTISVSISAAGVPAGTYNVLLGAQHPDIATSKYLTVTVQ
ncbi:MAG: lyase [Nitrosopumilus sp. B06]|nr:MAG: lyase [Nitrosopumilus sp. D6]RNJ80452.1 MAG: lyase [Nitrosopumilus sp. B06]